MCDGRTAHDRTPVNKCGQGIRASLQRAVCTCAVCNFGSEGSSLRSTQMWVPSTTGGAEPRRIRDRRAFEYVRHASLPGIASGNYLVSRMIPAIGGRRFPHESRHLVWQSATCAVRPRWTRSRAGSSQIRFLDVVSLYFASETGRPGFGRRVLRLPTVPIRTLTQIGYVP